MRIREYVQGRGRLVRLLNLRWIVGPLALLLFIVPGLNQMSIVFGALTAFFLLLVASYAIAWQTKCPRCRDRLFTLTLRAAKPSFARTPAFCSHCGVSLDEPMEGPPR